MKINGVEVDMQKVLRLYEREKPSTRSEETKQKISDWWDTTAGQAQRERNSEYMKNHPERHRQRLKYILINIEDDDDKHLIEGQQEVAKFLGYKRWNSTMNVSIRANKSNTKEYQIIRLEGDNNDQN